VFCGGVLCRALLWLLLLGSREGRLLGLLSLRLLNLRAWLLLALLPRLLHDRRHLWPWLQQHRLLRDRLLRLWDSHWLLGGRQLWCGPNRV
jgi:hypothetical protein